MIAYRIISDHITSCHIIDQPDMHVITCCRVSHLLAPSVRREVCSRQASTAASAVTC